MTEPRLVDDLLAEAKRCAEQAGASHEEAARLAQQLLDRICTRWGGERHYIHSTVLTYEERISRIRTDKRPPQVVAQELGVSESTVRRARRIISSGVR